MVAPARGGGLVVGVDVAGFVGAGFGGAGLVGAGVGRMADAVMACVGVGLAEGAVSVIGVASGGPGETADWRGLPLLQAVASMARAARLARAARKRRREITFHLGRL